MMKTSNQNAYLEACLHQHAHAACSYTCLDPWPLCAPQVGGEFLHCAAS